MSTATTASALAIGRRVRDLAGFRRAFTYCGPYKTTHNIYYVKLNITSSPVDEQRLIAVSDAHNRDQGLSPQHWQVDLINHPHSS